MSGGGAHRVVIVGAGFGGLWATKALRRAADAVEVTLVDRTNHHLFQPLLYQVATGILSEGEIAPATRDVLRRQRNVRVELAEVRAVNTRARELELLAPDGSTRSLGYDSLIVAGGMVGSYFGHDQFACWAPGMKSIEEALHLRAQIFTAFEMAEWETDPAQRRAWLTFAVIGGGPTGVELAGQIGELARRSLTRNFRNFDPAEARILLYDAGERILPTFGPRLSRRAARALDRLGAEIHEHATVVDLDAHSITVKARDGTSSRIEARTKIWAAGVKPAPLARMLADASGAELDRKGRVEVSPDCSIPGLPEVFVVGDMMSLDDLPGLAEVAMQSGSHAAKVICSRACGGRAPGPFHYRDLGAMAAVSRSSAVASFRGLELSGRLGWLAWLLVHILFLTGFKNRFTTVVHWAITFIGRGRAERSIPTTSHVGSDFRSV
ncbi:MAG: NAD(P)/FAD-dependent oxidoreductase [Solirubrobacteraceae bacterium]